MFSIVTISFNQGAFLADAIDSVLGQQGAEIEYIVCDPGSGDGSRDIIDSYRDRIATRVYEPDDGPADGLNHGFAKATGDVFAYLNSDDMFLPGAFERVARHFARRPDVDVLIGHCNVIDRHGALVRRAWSEPYTRRMAAYAISAQFQPSTFIRADAFRRTNGFNPHNRSSWDSELLLDLFQSGARIEILDEFLSAYRLHRTSITNTGARRSEAAQFERGRFERLMGRSWQRRDAFFFRLHWLWKKVRHPRLALERVVRGPVTSRGLN